MQKMKNVENENVGIAEDELPFEVVFFQRKPRKYGSFSVEFVFNAVRENLPPNVNRKLQIAKYESIGLWKRLYIALASVFQQGDVNHIVGDNHFAAIFLRKQKTILTILDVVFMNHSSKLAKAVLKFFWITVPVKRAGLITTISQASKDELLKHTSCDPNKIKVVYVPISDKFIPVPKKFNKNKPVILQLGCLPHKNIDRLIEALKDIPCHLEIIGKLSEELTSKLVEYQISHRISWNISEDEVRQKYLQSDIITLISTYEGFGMPIVEANATGRVVITSNILSMPEVAANAAHLVDPYNVQDIRNGIMRIIEDDDYRDQLIQNGYENRERFTEKKIALDYYYQYKSVYKKH